MLKVLHWHSIQAAESKRRLFGLKGLRVRNMLAAGLYLGLVAEFRRMVKASEGGPIGARLGSRSEAPHHRT